MQKNEMRFLAQGGNSPLNVAVARSLEATGGWAVPNLRETGFRSLQELIDLDLPPEFRTAAPLPERAQVLLDTAVVEVGLDRLTVAADIMAAGLVYNLTDPLSVTQLEWNATNKVGAAQRTMSPSARGENKIPQVLPNRLPVYLTTDTFELGIRELRMSQRVGMPLDTTLIKWCTRSVNEAIEDSLINGATTLDGQPLESAGYTAPGLLNAPFAATQALTLAAWRTAPVGTTVFNEVQLMLGKLRANKKYGPYRLYVNTEVGAALDADYSSAKGQNTIRQRIMQIEGLQAVRTADLIPENKVILLQMTSDVVDMVVGQRPTIVPWTSLDGFTVYNLVMAIMIPRVRYDFNQKSGVCIGTLS